jgi:purine-nucleoside phosphorylase
MYEHLASARDAVAPRIGATPEIAMVLGSGLGALAREVRDATVIPYAEIPHMPRSSVEGHAGELVVGTLGGRRVAILSGRVHYYEGHGMDAVVFGVRLAALLGIPKLFLTNAAGGVDTDMRPGDLMVIRDHIHTFIPSNPLRGDNDTRLGPRFPDMTEAYDRRMRNLLRDAAEELSIELHIGVYVCVPGPSYETPAEVRMLRNLGADAVGMSTTGECIAARHAGMRVVGLSCITNLAAGLGSSELSHEEVKETAGAASGRLRALVLRFLERLDEAGGEA